MRNPKKHKTSIILKLIIFTLCLVPLVLFPDRNTDFGKKLFFKWDLNQNKKLEIDELPKHARKNFQKVDVNNDGSISSQVRANQTSGFSIVTYTGNGNNATVGHGLGVKPTFVIAKRRSGGNADWFTFIDNNCSRTFFNTITTLI